MSPDPAKAVDAIVLAAGLSSRMRGFKPLLPLGGQSVLAHVVDVLKQGGVREVVVVYGHEGERVDREAVRLGARPVRNPDYREGMFSSMRHGFAALAPDCDAAFLLPVDIPLVRAWTVRQLLASYNDNPAPLLHPTFLGERGHPPLIARSLFSGIPEYAGEGGLRGYFENFEQQDPESVREVAVPDAGILQDMDTDASYAAVYDRHARLGVPTLEECEALYEDCGTPKPTRQHCRAVARVAVAFARALGDGLDLELVERAALVHDLAKGKSRHEIEGGRLLEERGFDAIAPIVASHRDIVPDSVEWLAEREAVFLADKLVKGEQLVPIEQRYGVMLRRYWKNVEAREAILGRFSRAQGMYRRATLQAAAHAKESVLLYDLAAQALSGE